MSSKKIRWFQWGDEKPGMNLNARIPNGGLNHGIDTVGKNEPGRIG